MKTISNKQLYLPAFEKYCYRGTFKKTMLFQALTIPANKDNKHKVTLYF